ncbi:MAG: QueT transporter family protein [Clostridiales bacterium]|nr:QueT transporter family protein [Clostridiales bacterium]
MVKYDSKYIAKAGIIAAIYVALTLALGSLSFSAIQVRISEALVILPFIDSAAIPGVFIGCLIANIFGGLGLVDIVFGSLVTLLAAYLTSKMPNRILAVVPPVVLNAFIVSIWVSKFSNAPYLLTVLTIGLGEFFSVGGLGILLLMAVEKINKH